MYTGGLYSVKLPAFYNLAAWRTILRKKEPSEKFRIPTLCVIPFNLTLGYEQRKYRAEELKFFSRSSCLLRATRIFVLKKYLPCNVPLYRLYPPAPMPLVTKFSFLSTLKKYIITFFFPLITYFLFHLPVYHNRGSYQPLQYVYVNVHYIAHNTEAEFFDVTGTKVLRVFLLAIHSHLYYQILLPPPPLSKKCFKTGLLCNYCIRKPQVWEFSETSMKLYVHEFGFSTHTLKIIFLAAKPRGGRASPATPFLPASAPTGQSSFLSWDRHILPVYYSL